MREDMIINGAALGSFAVVDSFGKLDQNLYRKLKKVQRLFVELIWFGPHKEPKKYIIESVLNGSVVEVPSGAAFMFDLSLWRSRPCMPSDVFLYNEEFILGFYAKSNGLKIFQSERLHCKHLGGISSTGAHILQIRKTLHQSHSIYSLYHNHMGQNKAAVTFVSFIFALKSLPSSALKDIKYCVKNFL